MVVNVEPDIEPDDVRDCTDVGLKTIGNNSKSNNFAFTVLTIVSPMNLEPTMVRIDRSLSSLAIQSIC